MDTPTISNNPLMPPAKQQRIMIWRNEVASALSANSAPSLASSHTSTSLSSTPLSDDVPDEHAAPSRSRPSLWKRLSSRFNPRSRSRSRDKAAQLPAGLGADRTSMYRSEQAAQARLEGEEDGLRENSEDGARGLKEKQERLRRAARLLNQGGRREDEV